MKIITLSDLSDAALIAMIEWGNSRAYRLLRQLRRNSKNTRATTLAQRDPKDTSKSDLDSEHGQYLADRDILSLPNKASAILKSRNTKSLDKE